jgi:hypothetical protein
MNIVLRNYICTVELHVLMSLCYFLDFKVVLDTCFT